MYNTKCIIHLVLFFLYCPLILSFDIAIVFVKAQLWIISLWIKWIKASDTLYCIFICNSHLFLTLTIYIVICGCVFSVRCGVVTYFINLFAKVVLLAWLLMYSICTTNQLFILGMCIYIIINIPVVRYL